MSWADWDQASAEFGIPENVRSQLRLKLESGQPLDSMLGGEPVETDVTTTNDWKTTVNRFPDGSVTATKMQIGRTASSGAISPMSLSQCSVATVTGGKKYSNCYIYTWVGTLSASFRADYIIYTSKPDTITAKREAHWSFAYGTEVYNKEFKTIRATENASGPACVEIRADYKVAGFPLGYAALRLYVGGNTAWDAADG